MITRQRREPPAPLALAEEAALQSSEKSRDVNTTGLKEGPPDQLSHEREAELDLLSPDQVAAHDQNSCLRSSEDARQVNTFGLKTEPPDNSSSHDQKAPPVQDIGLPTAESDVIITGLESEAPDAVSDDRVTYEYIKLELKNEIDDVKENMDQTPSKEVTSGKIRSTSSKPEVPQIQTLQPQDDIAAGSTCSTLRCPRRSVTGVNRSGSGTLMKQQKNLVNGMLFQHYSLTLPQYQMPVMLVIPSQPSVASVSVSLTSSVPLVTSHPLLPPKPKVVIPKRIRKPCAACGVFNCGGQRRRYMPSKEKRRDSSKKIFTFCPKTRKSLTPGFIDRVYDSFEHFQKVVDTHLAHNP